MNDKNESKTGDKVIRSEAGKHLADGKTYTVTTSERGVLVLDGGNGNMIYNVPASHVQPAK